MSRFRTVYRELLPSEKAAIESVKIFADQLAGAIEGIPAGREKSLAITKLEEAVMWAVKGITG